MLKHPMNGANTEMCYWCSSYCGLL